MMTDFPCLNVTWVNSELVVANSYNPNKVESEEMKLLRHSIEEDGLTQAPVVFYDEERGMYEIVDGFHRYLLLTTYFKCSHIPVVIISGCINDRMSSTVRHNRARGKHQIDLMERMTRKLADMGWKNSQIAKHLGMKAEEVLRLRQTGGIAEYYKHRQYSRAWVWVEESDEE